VCHISPFHWDFQRNLTILPNGIECFCASSWMPIWHQIWQNPYCLQWNSYSKTNLQAISSASG
jgi:hypothetical protein